MHTPSWPDVGIFVSNSHQSELCLGGPRRTAAWLCASQLSWAVMAWPSNEACRVFPARAFFWRGCPLPIQLLATAKRKPQSPINRLRKQPPPQPHLFSCADSARGVHQPPTGCEGFTIPVHVALRWPNILTRSCLRWPEAAWGQGYTFRSIETLNNN